MSKSNYEWILAKYDGIITGESDLFGDKSPTVLFTLLGNTMRYLLDPDPNTITAKSIAWRKRIHPLIMALGPHFLANPQVFENRNYLRNPSESNPIPDDEIVLPDEPVIWVGNHSFKDDGLATVLAAKRHSYLIFASLPQFFNTFDGLSSWANGVVMANRKIRASRQSIVPKAVHAMNLGADTILFPEGVWNKTPNRLLIDFWPGLYRLACETGAKVVPIIHYLRDAVDRSKDNPIHTVVDDPIRIDNLSEASGLEFVRDVMATWYYLMMEVYGKSSREKVLRGNETANIAWEEYLRERVGVVDFYDTEIELNADYRPKSIVRPEQVWNAVAKIKNPTIENILDVEYAKQLILDAENNDFQRRF